MKHTPGPWEFVPSRTVRHSYPIGCETHYGGEVISGVTTLAHCPIGGPHIANWENNARLIAAAPDLLEACKRALPALESAIPWAVGQTMEERHNNPIMVQLRTAIAKATGGKP